MIMKCSRVQREKSCQVCGKSHQILVLAPKKGGGDDSIMMIFNDSVKDSTTMVSIMCASFSKTNLILRGSLKEGGKW